MKQRLLGAAFLFCLALVATLAVWLILPGVEDKQQRTTSDAAKTRGKVRLAMDNWVGYFPLCSPEMKGALRRKGWLLECMDDQADYRSRIKGLKEGEIDLAVATIDSYILNSAEFDFPATIIAVIDESKGGDAIVALEKRVASLEDLKGRTDIRVAFTPASPSHHLIKAAADHFNVPELHPHGELRIETDGSAKARDKLLSGGAEVAVLWEPDVSLALDHPGVKKLLGSEDTERLIVDILLVRRQFSQKNPELIQQFLRTYFRVLKKYRDHPALLEEHLRQETGLEEDRIRPMLNGVQWASFMDNCEKWFGIGPPQGAVRDTIIDTIDSTVEILISANDFAASPVPDNDPYRLTNSTFLQELFTGGMSGFQVAGSPGAAIAVDSLAAPFPPLDLAGWTALREVGTLKVEPIVFQQGAATLNLMARQVIDKAMERLTHYPNFRVSIKGHTGTRGDEQANIRLSQARADAVMEYMVSAFRIDPNRLQAHGFGAAKPLGRKPGESLRAYEYRLPRVELALVREEI